MSPPAGTPAGPTTPARSYTRLSCVEPANDFDTHATRRRRGFRPRPGAFSYRTTTTWCLIVCRFFLPE